MKNKILLLIGIILLALFLRLVKLDTVPLYGDELTITQDAYSILQTGKDVTGKAFPLTFSMGAGRPGGYVYSSIPFVAVFGENAWGVRGLSVLSGLGIIIAVYLLGKKLFSPKLGLIATFMVAISPWAINLSRGGYEANYALLLALLGTYTFLNAKEKPFNYILTVLLWGLTIFTYPTYKLILPIFALPLIWYTGGIKHIFSKSKTIYVAIAIIMGLLFVGFSLKETFTSNSEERFTSINIFTSGDVSRQIIEKINFERSKITLPYVDRIFHNKPLEYFNVFKDNYLANFSLDYIFINGDGNPRHNMTQSGVLFVAEIVTLILGFYYLAKKDKKILIFLGSWILIVPLATALVGVPHNLRNAFMFPILTIVSSLGILAISDIEKKNLRKILLSILIIFIGIQFIFQMERLYLISTKVFEKAWSYPAARASDIAINERGKYDYVFLSDRIDAIEYAYPVYGKVNALAVQQTNKAVTKIEEYSFKKYGNVYVGSIPKNNINSFINNISGSVLYIGNEDADGEVRSNSEIIKFTDKMLNLVVVRKER